MGFFQTVRSHFGFSHEELEDAPTSDEIATRRVQQMAGLMKWLPNPDLILQKTGKRIKHLRELLYDDEVFSCVQYLHGALRESEWQLEAHPGDEQATELMRDWLAALDWERIDNEIIEARLFGYQPFEIDWQQDGGFWRPADLVGKPPEWFAYTRKNDLALRSKIGSAGLREDLQELPPGKFITARNKPSYDNPYGQAVLSRCWWPVVFKKGDLKYWITFAEKFGMPHAVGKHPRGAKNEEIEQLLDMLSSMVRDAVAAIPDDSSVELLESPFRGSSSSVYKAIIEWTERTVNKVILSNEMTTTAGQHGTQALGGEQIKEVSATVVNDCKRMKAALAQKLVRLAWHYNFGPASDAPAYEEVIEEEAGKERSERDNNLTKQGVRFTPDYYKREYNLQDDDFELTEAQPQPSGSTPPAASNDEAPPFAAFADVPGSQAVIDTLLDDAATPEEDQAAMEELLEEPIRLVREGEDPDAVMASLARAYPQMDATQLEKRLRSLFFIAETWGRLSVDAETEGSDNA